MLQATDIESLQTIAIAAACGAVLGFEREIAGKPAGIRTHIFVCAGSALMMILGQEIVNQFQQQETNSLLKTDPIRILQAIVVGISFLGAGTIVHQKHEVVEGLTTAATIYLTTGNGGEPRWISVDRHRVRGDRAGYARFRRTRNRKVQPAQGRRVTGDGVGAAIALVTCVTNHMLISKGIQTMRYSLTLLLLLGITLTVDTQASDDSMIHKVEQAIVSQTNGFRKEHGLPPVDKNEGLTKAASEFAKFMAKTDKYGHRADGRTPAQRAKATGYKYCVVRENIAYRTNTGEVASDSLIEVFVQGWIDSPPHRENMLADYVTETGVAVATTDDVTYYAVQLFGRPKSAAIKLKVTNESDETRTLRIAANDSEDEVELPPRAGITMKRCFPTTLTLADSDAKLELNKSTDIRITKDGFNR